MTGPIPASLGALASLEAAYLGGHTNRLTGALPPLDALAGTLAYFDVDGRHAGGHSDFSGAAVPRAWADLPLVDLKLKYTNLGGALPALNFTRLAAGTCGWR